MRTNREKINKLKDLREGDIAVIVEDNIYMRGEIVTYIPGNHLLLLLGRKDTPWFIDPIKHDYDCILLRKGDTITM